MITKILFYLKYELYICKILDSNNRKNKINKMKRLLIIFAAVVAFTTCTFMTAHSENADQYTMAQNSNGSMMNMCQLMMKVLQ